MNVGGRGVYIDVAYIDLVLHNAKTGDIAYMYDIAIIHSYRDILIGLWIGCDIGSIYSFIHY